MPGGSAPLRAPTSSISGSSRKARRRQLKRRGRFQALELISSAVSAAEAAELDHRAQQARSAAVAEDLRADRALVSAAVAEADQARLEARQQQADEARVALADAGILQRAAAARAAEQREDAARAESAARDIAHARQLAARELAADRLRAQLERQSVILRGTEQKLSALQAARLTPGAAAPVAPTADAKDAIIAQLRFQLSETHGAAQARSLGAAASFVRDSTNDFSAASGPPAEVAERSPVSPSGTGAGLPETAAPPAGPPRDRLRLIWARRTTPRDLAYPPGPPEGRAVIAPLPPWAERPGGA
jgi:hypothetical protein